MSDADDTNPNADPDRRRELQNELSLAMIALLKERAGEIADVSDNVPSFFMALYGCFANAMLTVQAVLEPDKSMTVDQHMRNQFIAAREAFKGLAEKNAAIWHEPPKLTRRGS